MNGKLSIKPFDKDTMQVYVIASTFLYDYEIVISASLDKNFEEIISNLDDFDKIIDCCITICSNDNESMDILKKIKSDKLNYINNASDIEFFYKPEVVANFIKKNPILLNKRIIFNDYNLLNNNLINEIEDAFGDNTSNIYFKIQGNYSLITFDEYKKTTCCINKKIEDIKRFDFSPLEKIMYVYDMVRDKVYLEVDEDEDKMNSRNLSSALLGNKIVCVGYSVIFQTLLSKLGIDCHTIRLDCLDDNGGHARIAIHVKDDKYGIDGVYFFDPTWNSKTNANDNKFLLSYKYFALTKEKIDEYDNGKFLDRRFPYFSADIAWKFDDLVYEVGIKGLPDELVNSINSMSYFVTGDILIKNMRNYPIAKKIFKLNKYNIRKKIYELTRYFNNPISADVLLEVLYNVRKQQYYYNPEKYPFDLNDFYKTVLMSNWDFSDTQLNQFLMMCYSNDDIKLIRTIKFAEENELDKRIEQVKLTKTLRNIYDNKIK